VQPIARSALRRLGQFLVNISIASKSSVIGLTPASKYLAGSHHHEFASSRSVMVWRAGESGVIKRRFIAALQARHAVKILFGR